MSVGRNGNERSGTRTWPQQQGDALVVCRDDDELRERMGTLCEATAPRKRRGAPPRARGLPRRASCHRRPTAGRVWATLSASAPCWECLSHPRLVPPPAPPSHAAAPRGPTTPASLGAGAESAPRAAAPPVTPPCCPLVRPRARGGLTAEHVLKPCVPRPAALRHVPLERRPSGRLAHVLQQLAQPVITALQWSADRPTPVAQRVLPALDGRGPRPLPGLACREARRQPAHRRPAPPALALLPRPGERPVEPLDNTHRDPLTAAQGHSSDALRDDHQVAVSKALLDLWCQWHAHGALLSHDGAAWESAEHRHVMVCRYIAIHFSAHSKDMKLWGSL